MFGRQKESQGGLLDAPPKTTFILGLFVGIAATAIVSLIVVVPLLNSNDSSGAVKGTNTNTTNQAADADTGGSVVDIATPDSDTDHYRGAKPEEAAIVLVEYSDFQCPYCQKFQPIAKQLVDDYDGQLSWVYRHFPLSGHANAKPAAEAAECAGKLGGNDVFWQYADKLYVNQNSLSKDYYKELAGELGLNAAKFASCLDSGEFTSKIEAQFNEGASAGVNGTPASIVLPGNDTSKGQLVSGALPVDQFKKSLTPLSSEPNRSLKKPLIVVGIGLALLVLIWLIFDRPGNNETTEIDNNSISQAEAARQAYNDLFSIYWRQTSQVSNVSLEATYFPANLREALLNITDPSDHQLAMQQAMEKIAADKMVWYVVITQNVPFSADPELGGVSRVAIDENEQSVSDWLALDPLWLDQSEYYQQDGFLATEMTDTDFNNLTLTIGYPAGTRHQFAWPIILE